MNSRNICVNHVCVFLWWGKLKATVPTQLWVFLLGIQWLLVDVFDSLVPANYRRWISKTDERQRGIISSLLKKKQKQNFSLRMHRAGRFRKKQEVLFYSEEGFIQKSSMRYRRRPSTNQRTASGVTWPLSIETPFLVRQQPLNPEHGGLGRICDQNQNQRGGKIKFELNSTESQRWQTPRINDLLN